MRTKFSVARCCCGPPPEQTCELTADNFDRADSDSLDTNSPCGWTEQSGSTLAITSNEVTGTGTAICDYTKASLKSAIRAEGSFRFLATNGQVRVIYQWTDASNYGCVEWTHTTDKLRGRIITKQSGSETVRATFELPHTRDSDEVFDFCIVFYTGVAWEVKSVIVSQADPTTALTGAMNFSLTTVMAETGVSGFYLNGDCYLQSWELWKTPSDSFFCPTCYDCAVGEVYDDFSSGSVIMTTGGSQDSGMWEQRLQDGLYPETRSYIGNGQLLFGTDGGRVWHCWRKQNVEGFTALAQIELVETDILDVFYGANRIGFEISGAVPNQQIMYPVGFVAKYVWVSAPSNYGWRWHTYYMSNENSHLTAPLADGDVLKITVERLATTDRYTFKWYLNTVLLRTASSVLMTNWDYMTIENFGVYSTEYAVWDNMYFLSNADFS